jgi:hypothetical protein
MHYGLDKTQNAVVARQQETGHGRNETRTGVVVSAKGLAQHHEFPGLKAFGRVESRREIDGKVQSQTRYFALSWMLAPIGASSLSWIAVQSTVGQWNALHPLSGM